MSHAKCRANCLITHMAAQTIASFACETLRARQRIASAAGV